MSGTATVPGARVKIYLDDRLIGTAIADGKGNWSLTPQVRIAPGTYVLRADEETGDGKIVASVEASLTRTVATADGQTTVVVERVRHLMATDATLAPENILVLTYNVKAAAELMERLEQLLGL